MTNNKLARFTQSEVAALKLVTLKLYIDYCMAYKLNKAFRLEVEHFFEEWLPKNVINSTEDFNNALFREFLEILHTEGIK